MEEEKPFQDSKVYEDIAVEVYYAESMRDELRTQLSDELEDIYHEKYTSELPGAETFPIINISSQDESTLLIADEISFEAVKHALKNI